MLTTEEQEQARALGWELRDIYELQTCRLRIVPMATDWPTTSVHATMATVIQQARERHAVAIKALKLVAQSNIYRGAS
jgi:hypothetical protein